MKLFSQNLEVLNQCGAVINPQSARKRVQTFISCTNGDKNLQMYLYSHLSYYNRHIPGTSTVLCPFKNHCSHICMRTSILIARNIFVGKC